MTYPYDTSDMTELDPSPDEIEATKRYLDELRLAGTPLQDATSDKQDWRTPGSSNPNSRFTPDQVRQMRRLREGGESLNSLAKLFGVARSTVANVVNRVKYKDVI